MQSFNTLISAADLSGRLPAGRIVLFDCGFDLADPGAGLAAYRAGHLPGARYLHLDHDLADPVGDGSQGRHPLPDLGRLAQTLRAAGLRAGDQVVAYDAAGGTFAARLWWLLRWMGHDAVALLDGGRQAWTEAGLPLEPGEPPAERQGDFVPLMPDPDAVLHTDRVQAAIGSPDWLVVDARTPARYRGEPNPLDPVAGHIPGARNRFFRDNLGPDGRFKPAATLAAEFDAVLAGTDPSHAVMQCGSGVTACHNLLALEIAGRPGARLYPGSWSAWIADPSRPVARD